MKTIQNKFKTLLLLILVGLAFTSCSKDDGGDAPEPENQAPNSFNLNEVANGATQPQLSWEEATDPDGDDVSYKVYLDTQKPPQIAVANNLGVNTFSVEEELQPETTYYWKVFAKDSEGNTTESEVASFTSRDKNNAEKIIGKWFYESQAGQPPFSECFKMSFLQFSEDLSVKNKRYTEDSSGNCSSTTQLFTYEIIGSNQIEISNNSGDISTNDILFLTETNLVLGQSGSEATYTKE